MSIRTLIAGVVLLGLASAAAAELVPCRQPSDARPVEEALARLRAAADPCGESAEVAAVLGSLTTCGAARYEICIDTASDRNLFDRPTARDRVRTIVWNPSLTSDLEPRCDDRSAAVRREPTASLLHELVHAAHDCAGMDPGQHELEAVRIENIYRRSANLPQRAGYGDEKLPPSMRRLCDSTTCACDIPSAAVIQASLPPPPAMPVGPIADNPLR